MNDIIDKIKQSNNIILLCHKNPDGDAIGSTLSLYHTLKKMNKEVDVVIEGTPTKFDFIDGFNDIKVSSDKKYRLGIILDTSSEERINAPNNILDNIGEIIVVDHHISNTKYGSINYVDKRPACCEIMYNLIKEMNVEIDEKIAIPLVSGMLSDTGGLSHPDVLPSTYKMAADLSEIVDVPWIYKKVLNTITIGQFKLNKIATENLEFHKDNQITFTYITEEHLNNLGLERNEVDYLANLGRNISGVEVAIFVRRYKEENRVSLRSNNIDVNEVAKVFNCGGHKNAAGISSTMEFNLLKEKLIEEVGKKIDEWRTSN